MAAEYHVGCSQNGRIYAGRIKLGADTGARAVDSKKWTRSCDVTNEAINAVAMSLMIRDIDVVVTDDYGNKYIITCNEYKDGVTNG